ncbi:protein-glutamate O-methyltransferase CheR [Christensenellaceae bacterium OttesenSCG-928-L17]|nr:protein-glutamate O-methyltransferase CheR [Christensenellaceae bacterium OttesenSCG-928-L17]
MNAMLELSDREFDRLVKFMHERYGINLSRKRVLIEGRLRLMLSQRGYTSYTAYIDDLERDVSGKEVSTLVSKLTTNYTYFLREETHYDFMTAKILPKWRTERRPGGYQIWSAACSSGEEPYSISMVVSNFFGFSPHSNIAITASDISDGVLTKARAGNYTADQIEKLPPAWVTSFFVKNADNTYTVSNALKKMVTYQYFNLNATTHWPRQHYDVIFCRNVMIYFDVETKKRLVARLYEALKPGGYLFIGMSETLINLGVDFVYVQPSIYQKKP